MGVDTGDDDEGHQLLRSKTVLLLPERCCQSLARGVMHRTVVGLFLCVVTHAGLLLTPQAVCIRPFHVLDRRLSSKTKRPITAEEQEFFDVMELNIQRKQVKLPEKALRVVVVFKAVRLVQEENRFDSGRLTSNL